MRGRATLSDLPAQGAVLRDTKTTKTTKITKRMQMAPA